MYYVVYYVDMSLGSAGISMSRGWGGDLSSGLEASQGMTIVTT